MKKQYRNKPKKFSYKDVAKLIDEELKSSVFLTGRAWNTLKKAEYQDPQLVWQAVELLATYYPKMRKALITREEFIHRCRELGLDYRRSSTDVTAGMQGKKYFTDYNGSQRKLEFHLTKGSAKEPRKCLRIYFFWDEDNELVVIGHLPDHLNNSRS